jgi:hypothetical protein
VGSVPEDQKPADHWLSITCTKMGNEEPSEDFSASFVISAYSVPDLLRYLSKLHATSQNHRLPEPWGA